MRQTIQYIKVDIFKIILPPLLTILLFVGSVFTIVLPSVQSHLLQQKKSVLTSGTKIAWDILQYYEHQVATDKLSIDEARQKAINQIRGLRYGADGKDYFWINDLHPTMIMHPYRPDLEGEDLSTYADPKGKLLFKEFVEVARKKGSGFVEYVWQWKDDPDRLVPKISNVKLFQPWGWVVGTGVYIEDIRTETARLKKEILIVALVILAAISCLSIFVINNTLHERKKRRIAEEELTAYKDHLEELVEQRTAELQQANNEVKTLSGLLPICASCKKIKDDEGHWGQIESYVSEHSDADFSHTVCPECAERLYPGYL
jgi:signal transduction histidine kinase